MPTQMRVQQGQGLGQVAGKKAANTEAKSIAETSEGATGNWERLSIGGSSRKKAAILVGREINVDHFSTRVKGRPTAPFFKQKLPKMEKETPFAF